MVAHHRFPRWLRWITYSLITLVLAGGLGFMVFSWQKGWLDESYWAARRGCENDLAWSGGGPPLPGAGGVTLTSMLETVPLPTDMVFLDQRRALISDQQGTIHLADVESGESRVVADLSPMVSSQFDQGLLALALDPGQDRLVVSYTGQDGDSTIATMSLDDGVPDVASHSVVLRVDQDDVYHNGGGLRFGPEGLLHATFGDGGLYGDRNDNGQRSDTLLGAVLRIDIDGAEPYAVPPDNPFVDGDGAGEVWLTGTRNPYRLSFDPANGDLWIADVGHDCIEEITRVPAGTTTANLGWNRYEGTRRFVGGAVPDELRPTFEYPHDDRWCAVIGGQVSRDGRLPDLVGRYLFADFCSGEIVVTPAVAGARAETVMADVGVVLGFATDPALRNYVLGIGRISRLDPS